MSRARLDLVMPLASPSEAAAVAGALGIETKSSPAHTTVTLRVEGSDLHMHIEGDEARSIRAAAHSYLRLAETSCAVARTVRPA